MGIPSAHANARDDTRVKAAIILLMAGVLASPLAHGDGGTVQLHEASGPFLVTVFALPEPLRVGAIDTSVLVQDRQTGRVILDATVDLAFQPVGDASPRFLTHASHAEAKNKLLQAGMIDVQAPGWWAVEILVRRDRESAVLATKVHVLPAEPRWSTIWPFLIVPPFAIAVFVLHDSLRRSRVR
jgi:hypothetical protein